MYQYDPDRAPDSRFVPGTPTLIVSGNAGRMLDPRRTPVRVLSVDVDRGMFTVEVLGFEDAGALWKVPLEFASRFQIAVGSPVASEATQAAMQAAIECHDQPLRIDIDAAVARQTEHRLASSRRDATAWLAAHSEYFAVHETLDLDAWTGPDALQRDLCRYLGERDLMDMEREFAARYVSNPWPVGAVKGHRVVIAELGLCAFQGKKIRDPELFAGRWSREQRARHILARMGFVQQVFRRAGHEQVTLFRGMPLRGPLRPPPNRTFVSSSFKRELAESFFDTEGYDGVLLRARVPVERLFMTYQETMEMNQQYKEAEALLLVCGRESPF